jgi:hypothetical protein
MRKRTRNILRITYIISLILTVLSSCEAPKKEILDTEKIIQNSNTFLDNWHKAASDADYSNYFDKMDSISVFIGTDATENWPKKEFESFSKPYFDKGKAWSFTAIERNVYVNEDGTFIWFDELLDTWMGICRGSGVLEMKNNKLTIKHYVLSATVPNDEIQKVIAIKKVTDSLLIRKTSDY